MDAQVNVHQENLAKMKNLEVEPETLSHFSNMDNRGREVFSSNFSLDYLKPRKSGIKLDFRSCKDVEKEAGTDFDARVESEMAEYYIKTSNLNSEFIILEWEKGPSNFMQKCCSKTAKQEYELSDFKKDFKIEKRGKRTVSK